MKTRSSTLRRGELYVWASAVALAAILVVTFGLLAVLAVNGASVFWPRALHALALRDGRRVLATVSRRQPAPKAGSDGWFGWPTAMSTAPISAGSPNPM